MKIHLPDDWLKMDAICLRGAYEKILTEIREQFAEANLEIVDESVIDPPEPNNEEYSVCRSFIIWVKIREEDEGLVDWLQNLIASLIQQAELK